MVLTLIETICTCVSSRVWLDLHYGSELSSSELIRTMKLSVDRKQDKLPGVSVP